MVKGQFIDNTPIVKTTLVWGGLIQEPFLVLDSGFTGDVQITPDIAEELALKVTTVIPITVANGQTVAFPMATAVAILENSLTNVDVLISSDFNLAGIGLLSKLGYKMEIDCKRRTVQMELA